MSPPLEFTILFPFCGIGGGALGFLEERVTVAGREASFRVIGGIDNDNAACRDFTYLTKAPALCADIAELTPDRLREFAGEKAPDVVFLSAPCVGASKLVSDAKASTSKYRKMNNLGEAWIDLMLETWAEPPRLVLFENVPNLVSAKRGAAMVTRVKRKLGKSGYVLHDGTHDCGELGGLGQRRKRWLMVARHQPTVPPLLYLPPKKRVRGCDEVIGPMPMPGDPAGGPMHTLPRISWLNWVRLALIPAGGDWRDLPGVLVEGQKRREKFKRHEVCAWDEPTGVVGGSGSNSVANVADERFALSPSPNRHDAKYTLRGWEQPAKTVTGATRPGSGSQAVADPRVAPTKAFNNALRVNEWGRPAGTVTGAASPSNGAICAADPRAFPGGYQVQMWDAPARAVTGEASVSNGASVADKRFGNVDRVTPWDEPVGTITHSPAPSSGAPATADPRVDGPYFRGILGVIPWAEPAKTVTGSAMPSRGPFSVADPRPALVPSKAPFDKAYGVLRFEDPARTIAAGSDVGQGAYAVGDPRLTCAPRAGAYGVLDWREAARTITGAAGIDNGTFAIADVRVPEASPVCVVRDVRKAPEGAPPVILAEDGTWHRPLTTLELARLQDLPLHVNGAPLRLSGSSHTDWRKRIGNAVPVGAARALAGRMLRNLAAAATGAFLLDGTGSVWVRPERAAKGSRGRRVVVPAAMVRLRERAALLGRDS